MKTIHGIVVLVLCVFPQFLFACGPEWTYKGVPSGTVLCITATESNPEQFLCGTYGRGVFRYAGQDTIWESSGLENQRVWQLQRYSNYPRTLFAVASGGIYYSADDGFSWNFLTQVSPSRLYEPMKLDISLFDSSEWACAAWDLDLTGRIYISNDAGQTWHILFVSGLIRDIQFSTERPGRLYFAQGTIFRYVQIPDSTFEIIDSTTSVIFETARHTSNEWYYLLSENWITRYNEQTNELIHVSLPDSFGTMDKIRMTSHNEPLIGGATGMYKYTEDLSFFVPIIGLLPEGYVAPYFISQENWVALAHGERVYCRNAETSIPFLQEHDSKVKISVFPNPSYSGIYFQVSQYAHVSIYNLMGQNVSSFDIVNTESPAVWNPNYLPSGTYYYCITSRTFSDFKPIFGRSTLLK